MGVMTLLALIFNVRRGYRDAALALFRSFIDSWWPDISLWR
jgi:hypothetical protein